MRYAISLLLLAPLSTPQVWAGGSTGVSYCPYGQQPSVFQTCTASTPNPSTRRALQNSNSSCEYRSRNGEIKQGKVMQTVDNKDVCVVTLSQLTQMGESCQLGIYNGWNPLRNWEVSGKVSQTNEILICSASEIPAEPHIARPPLPTRAELLNLQ